MVTTGYWQVVTLTESGDLAGIERAVGELALAHSVFRHEDGKRWRVEAICDHAPEEWPLSGETTVQPLEMRDWVAESQAALPALDIGRFHVRGGWDRRGHAGQIDLVIEAGQAFGTGRHESTEGCLVVLQQVARQRRVFSVLDVGTGAGILAIAAARLTGARAVGTDIDPVSIDVAIENADLNRAGTRCRFTTADGTRHGLIASGRPYDLVFANILARPLASMSGMIAREVAPGGDLILAGILNHQVPLVLSRYRPLGLRLVHHRRRNGWSILRLSRPGV
ncbi:MAG: 50S ribosomal protein L11 methyltransferase [Pseudomonadota bacterium]|nr:50S ribosomal protein L11 methyltransferase [Pseudomonadota bacterium]